MNKYEAPVCCGKKMKPSYVRRNEDGKRCRMYKCRNMFCTEGDKEVVVE